MAKTISFSGRALEDLHEMVSYAIDGVRTERGLNTGNPMASEDYFNELDRLEDCYIKLEQRIAKKLGIPPEKRT